MHKLIVRPNNEVTFFPKYVRSFFDNANRHVENSPASSSYVPRVNISEDTNNIFVHAELPGLTKDDVKVTVTDGTLVLRGEKKSEVKTEDRKYFRIEQRYGEFVRQFTLPENVNEDEVKASFENGILEVIIPKKEPEKPKEREIPINVSVN
jgi:HSP20 family protein